MSYFQTVFAILLIFRIRAEEKTLKDFDKGPFGLKPDNGKHKFIQS